jgi:hypothetical protein
MKAWSAKGVAKLAWTTCAAEAIASSASPRFSASRVSAFPRGDQLLITGVPARGQGSVEQIGPMMAGISMEEALRS